jgi:hypothetical protein
MLKNIKPNQKINQIPGLNLLTLNLNLAKSMNNMKKRLPDDFNFYPKSWIFPYELENL